MEKDTKKFISPYAEVVYFSNEDIITLSLGDTIGDGGDNEEDF